MVGYDLGFVSAKEYVGFCKKKFFWAQYFNFLAPFCMKQANTVHKPCTS
jgi:hypothetical protein